MGNWAKTSVVGLNEPIACFLLGKPEVTARPSVMLVGKESLVGTVNCVIACVVGLMSPTRLPTCSVNQRFPSGPVVISKGKLPAVGRGYSAMAWVVGLIMPIEFVPLSVNQMLPSGPAVIPLSDELLVTVNSDMASVVALISPILLTLVSVNQSVSFGPDVISYGAAFGVGVGKSTMPESRQRASRPSRSARLHRGRLLEMRFLPSNHRRIPPVANRSFSKFIW